MRWISVYLTAKEESKEKKEKKEKKEGLRVPSKESDKIADAGTASLLANQMTAWIGPCRRLFSLRKKIGGNSKRKKRNNNNNVY